MTVRQISYRLKSDGKAELKRDLAEVGQAGAAAENQIAAATDKANAATDRQMERWRKLADQAREAERIQERQATFNRLLNVGGGSAGSAADSASAFEAALGNRGKGLSAMQRNTLIYTGSDIVASAASGISPAMIAMQQGPQVLQAFAVQGGAAIGTMLKLGGAIGVVTAAVGLAAAAGLSYESALNKAEVAAQGLGASSGVTGGEILRLASTMAEAGGVSIAAARDMAVEYVSTGKIGGVVLGRLIALTRDYATTTQQDAADATKELGKVFADPAKGAETLNAKLHILDDATYRYIQTLVSQNKTTEAQLVLADRLGSSLIDTEGNINVLSRAWDGVARSASNAWSEMGRAINIAAGGGTPLERIASLQRRGTGVVTSFGGENFAALGMGSSSKRETDAIWAEWNRQQMAIYRASENAKADQARPIIDKLNPLVGRRRELESQRSTINDAMGSLSPESAAEARTALSAIEKDLKAVAAGYSTAAEQTAALERAQRSSAKAGRDAAKEAREAAREAKEAADQARRREDLRLAHLLDMAKLAGEKAVVADLERQQAIRSRIVQLQQAGVKASEAQVVAEREVGQEMLAEYEARMKAYRNPTGFKPLEQMRVEFAKAEIIYNANADAIAYLREGQRLAFDDLTESLTVGGRNWGRWKDAARGAIFDVVGDLQRLLVWNPIKNALFGADASGNYLPTGSSLGGIFGAILGNGKSSTGAGVLGSALVDMNPGRTMADILKQFPNPLGGVNFGGGVAGKGGLLGTIAAGIGGLFGIGRNADGTENWPGGWSWVGERGPELAYMPAGAKVLSAPASQKAMGAVTVNVTLNANGAGPNEVQELKGMIAQMQRDLPTTIVNVTQDGFNRGLLRPGR